MAYISIFDAYSDEHSFEGVVFYRFFAPTAEFGAVVGEDFFEFDAVRRKSKLLMLFRVVNMVLRLLMS